MSRLPAHALRRFHLPWVAWSSRWIGIACLVLGSCDRAPWHKSETEEATEAAAISVVVEPLQRGPLAARIEASSTIEAEQQVTVHAESSGRVVELRVEEGDTVRAGQRLARIRADAQAAGLDRARANLDQSGRDLATVERLFDRGVASRDEYERAKLAYETASLDVRDRRRDVGNTVVTAPFAGTITERMVTEGAFVTVGQPLVSITDFGSLVARVFLPEKELDRVAIGQVARVTGKAVRSRTGFGTVTRIAPVVDPATGTFKMTIALPVTEDGATFLPGMYAAIELTTERKQDALRVPRRALVRDEDEVYVFVAEGERARRVDLELGLEDGEWAEVQEGLRAGDFVVVEGQSGLQDGARIRRVDPNGQTVARAEKGIPEGA